MTIKPVTILKANNLSKHFDGLKVIDSLSFTIFKNQVTGLIGPNGAGKTTLFNLLSGFDTPTSGTILFDDDPIEHLPPPPNCPIRNRAYLSDC